MKSRSGQMPQCIKRIHLVTLLLSMTISNLVSATGVFKPGWELPGEVSTIAVALADADGDGDKDAWVLRDTQAPKILINGGTGTLIDNSNYFGANDSQDIRVGDMDGDGDQDALVVPLGGRAQVWLNNGSAQLTDSGQLLGSTNISRGSMLADVNGDGHLDALLKNTNSQFEIWGNNGSGVFINSGNLIGDIGTTYHIALGDLDLDGDLDAWVARDVVPRSNMIWTNNGTGVFTDSGTEYGPQDVSPYKVAIGDIDGDLDMDVLAAYCCQSSGGSQISDIVWRNDGKGSFIEEGTSLNLGPSASLIDVNGDGFLDAASGNIYVLNDTSGNFTGASQSFGDVYSQYAAFTDLTGNGAPDLYKGVNGRDTIWFNDGSANFADSGQRFGVYPASEFDLGDLDADGDLDAWIANQYGSPNEVWLNDGSGNFSNTGQEFGNSDTRAVDLGDLDGDGDLDVWVANNFAPSTVWLNDGSGNYTSNGQSLFIGPYAPSYNSPVRDVALGDADGDGDLDAWVVVYLDPNEVWLNDGTGFFVNSGQSLATPAAIDLSSSVELGDVDADGDLDAWVGFAGFPNQVWLNDGSGVFSDSLQNLGSSNTYDVVLADIDNDLDLDAITANLGAPNKVWLNDATGTYVDSGQTLGNGDSVNLDVADVNNDGFVDIWVANAVDTLPNKVWINDGTGVFHDSQQSLGRSWTRDVKLGDLDGDLKVDAFVANSLGDHRVWINMDNYCSTATPLLDDGPYSDQVYCGAETKITAGPLSIEPGADVTLFSPLIELLSDFSVKEGGIFGAGNSPLVNP